MFTAGVECEQVERYQTSIRDEWMVECTTAPGPEQSAWLFPGESDSRCFSSAHLSACSVFFLTGQRSAMTEFFSFTSDVKAVSKLPQSDSRILSERIYWNYKTKQPGFPASSFSQRTSGFFVPSKSCVYSFNLISDSESSLLWATDGEGNLTELAYSLDGTDERSVSMARTV